jgi:hypothetical protein
MHDRQHTAVYPSHGGRRWRIILSRRVITQGEGCQNNSAKAKEHDDYGARGKEGRLRARRGFHIGFSFLGESATSASFTQCDADEATMSSRDADEKGWSVFHVSKQLTLIDTSGISAKHAVALITVVGSASQRFFIR